MDGAIEVVGAGGYVVCGAGDGNVGFYGGGDFVAPQVTFLSPFGADLAMSGVKLSLQPVKSCIRDGSDHSLCIAGSLLRRLNACCSAIYPVCHGAVSIMVVGVHVFAPEVTIFHNAVPVLPDSGSALGHGVDPGWIFLAKKEGINQICVAIVAEHMEQIRRAYKAGFQLDAAIFYLFCQLVSSLLGIGSQIKMSGQNTLCLGLVLRVSAVKGADNVVIKSFILGNISPRA